MIKIMEKKLMIFLTQFIKMIKVFIRVSYKNKYINIRNNCAWSRKLLNIGNLLGGWINRCVRV